MFFRENERKARRKKVERRKCLKNILKRHKLRKLRESLTHWSQWTRAKIKRRRVVQAKVQSLQTICGDHLNSPQFTSEEEEEEEEDEAEEEEEEGEKDRSQTVLNRFISIVNQVIENTRKEGIVQEMLEKQKEREVIENCSFQFLADEESSLYRFLSS